MTPDRAEEGIVAPRRTCETSGMRTPLVAASLVAAASLFGACSEGFEDTVWSNDDRTVTLSLFDGGASLDERYLDRTTGEPVLTDGLRFEGTFTEQGDGFDADVRCVSAENARIAVPCDTKVARKLSCTVSEESEAKIACKVGKETIELVRDDARRVVR